MYFWLVTCRTAVCVAAHGVGGVACQGHYLQPHSSSLTLARALAMQCSIRDFNKGSTYLIVSRRRNNRVDIYVINNVVWSKPPACACTHLSTTTTDPHESPQCNVQQKVWVSSAPQHPSCLGWTCDIRTGTHESPCVLQPRKRSANGKDDDTPSDFASCSVTCEGSTRLSWKW